MNKESNIYTIAFATLMVVIVGGLLAFVSSSLKPAQTANVKNEKMQNILRAIDPSFKSDDLKKMNRDEIVALFNEHVKERVIIDYSGKTISVKSPKDEIDSKDESDAFNLNPRKQYSSIVKIKKGCDGDKVCLEEKMLAQNLYSPLFICEIDGETIYVTTFSGKGLWDDIWGYAGIKSSRTINATVFDHKGETPGLGSIITADWFQNQFQGKRIATEDDTYKPIKVLKPGKELNDFSVDGISGATFTGVGVDEMMGRGLVPYFNYFKVNNIEKTEEVLSIKAPPSSSSSYALEVNKENLVGEWAYANESLDLQETKLVWHQQDYGYSLNGDSIVINPANASIIGIVESITPSLLLVKWSDREFVTTYSKN
jgi:Na+-transporting NADH:ubiquinone oxidoreductase subunit C